MLLASILLPFEKGERTAGLKFYEVMNDEQIQNYNGNADYYHNMVHIGEKKLTWRDESRGLGCPQQAERTAAGGGAMIGISVKDIPIDCLPVLWEFV